MIVASSKDSESEALLIGSMDELYETTNCDIDKVAVVLKGVKKQNEQYIWNGTSWEICEIDWSDVFAKMSFHAGISPDVLDNRSLAFVKAINRKFNLNLHLKLGIPVQDGDEPGIVTTARDKAVEINKPGDAPGMEQLLGFCSGFK